MSTQEKTKGEATQDKWDLKYGRKDLEDRGTKNSEREIMH